LPEAAWEVVGVAYVQTAVSLGFQDVDDKPHDWAVVDPPSLRLPRAGFEADYSRKLPVPEGYGERSRMPFDALPLDKLGVVCSGHSTRTFLEEAVTRRVVRNGLS